MTKTAFTAEGMSCEHCVKAITKAVSALSGVANVAVDLSTKTIMVEHDATKISGVSIKSEIEGQGYEVVALESC